MEIVVTGRHTTVSDRFRQHIAEKLDKVQQLAPRTRRIEVVISHEPNRRQADGRSRPFPSSVAVSGRNAVAPVGSSVNT